MSTYKNDSLWTFKGGFHPDQSRTRGGIPGTVIAGEGVMFEDEGDPRTFGGWADTSEDNTPDTLAYTATLDGSTDIVEFSGGATVTTDFNPYQHVLLGRELYEILEIIDDTHVRVSPQPYQVPPQSGVAVARVPNLHSLNNKRASLYAGSVCNVRGEAKFAVGQGTLKIAGAATSDALAATTTMKVAYPEGGGTYDVRPVGFTKPGSLPSLSATAGGTKNMPSQAYSIKLSKKREGFSGYGPASEAIVGPSLAAGERYQITLPALDTGEGQTSWVIWATKANTEDTARGPWYKLGEYTTVTPTAIQIEWRSEELTDELVDTNEPPPPCLYVMTFNDLVLAVSFGDSATGDSYKAAGPGVAVSKPFNVEGFPEEARAWVTPAEDIVFARAGSVFCFFGTSSGISYGQLAGSDRTPLIIRPFWHSGMAHNYSGVMAGDVLYALTGSTVIRTATGSDVDFTFSSRVRSVLARIDNARAFLGYDPHGGRIVIFAANARVATGGKYQTMALAYNMKTDTWDTPVYLGDGTTADFTVTGCATVGERLCFVTAEGSAYTWDNGVQDVTGFLAPAFQDYQMPQYLKIARRIHVSGQINGSVKLYSDYDFNGLVAGTGTYPTYTLSNPSELPRHFLTWRPNWKGKSFSPRLAFSEMSANTRIVDDLHLEVEGRNGAVY